MPVEWEAAGSGLSSDGGEIEWPLYQEEISELMKN
jgi:hypothetical protein